MSRFSPYWLWLALSLPGLGMAYELAGTTNPRIYHILVHPTGEFAARFLIIAMLATPLMLLFKGWRGPRWLKKNRRYFGVAAFAYALAHTVFYLVDKAAMARIVEELPRLYIWTGWLAFCDLHSLGRDLDGLFRPGSGAALETVATLDLSRRRADACALGGAA